MNDEVDNIHNMPLDDLATKCGEETLRFKRHQSSDPRYCFEFFQRAFNRQQSAWDAIFVQYEGEVATWVRKHSWFGSSGEEVEYFVSEAFFKFWNAMMPDRFRNFPDLVRLLGYLRLCVHSVIADYTRSQDAAETFDPMEEPRLRRKHESRGTESDVLDKIRWQKCREWVDARLDEKERLVLKLYIDEALKPKDMFALFSEKFENVDEVYRIRQNVVARLSRDPEFDQFCGKG